MTREFITIDITNAPELRRLAEAVRQSGKPHALKDGGETVAVIRPTPKNVRPLGTSQRARRSSPFTFEEPLWKVLEIAEEAGPSEVSAHKDEYLAEAYAAIAQ